MCNLTKHEPTHGKTRRGRPRSNYIIITYIQKITGHQLSELIELAQNQEDWRQLVVECADPQPPDYKKRRNHNNSQKGKKIQLQDKYLFVCSLDNGNCHIITS